MPSVPPSPNTKQHDYEYHALSPLNILKQGYSASHLSMFQRCARDDIIITYVGYVNQGAVLRADLLQGEEYIGSVALLQAL